MRGKILEPVKIAQKATAVTRVHSRKHCSPKSHSEGSGVDFALQNGMDDIRNVQMHRLVLDNIELW